MRARREQLLEWLASAAPDVVCLQEIKVGPDKLPADLANLPGWHTQWHGAGGYSGVALLVREGLAKTRPEISIPPFDFEQRSLVATLDDLTIVSLYVPNGGKNFDDKMRFLSDLKDWAKARLESGESLLLAGDLNVAREEKDVHPKDRKEGTIGQRPEERQALAELLELGLEDLGRRHAPDADDLFTWWPPWRKRRERNIGWRIDYLLADEKLAERCVSCESHRTVGTSDHAPVTAIFG